MTKKVNLCNFKVNKNPCKTCPFAGSHPVKLSPDRSLYFYKNILNFKGQHLCHSTNNKTICRGLTNSD